MTPTPTPTRPGPAAGAPPRRPFPILPVALVVIAVIAAAVVLFSLGGDDDDATTEAGGSSPLVEGGRADPVTETDVAFAPITVEGDPLAEFDADAGTDATLGEVAPVLTGTAPDGTPVDTVAGGAPTVITVVAHWCPHCGAEVPRIVELVESGELPAETRIVALATASDESASNFPPGEWLADNDWTGDVLLDDEAATGALALGTSSFPFLVVLDGDGRVVERLAGEQPDGAIADAVAAASR